MSLHCGHVSLNGSDQRQESHEADVLITVEQESTQNVDGKDSEAVL